MSKRDKQRGKSGEVPSAPSTRGGQPPVKYPRLLAVSVVLFVLWFAFLLVTAVW